MKDHKSFISRASEEEGVREGVWQYWYDDENEIVAVARLERKKVFNKQNRQYEDFIYSS
jgi:hypothetical protein